ncbi:MAG: SecDF P1 head subdomain-containing protein, partial [Cumulibacter sp.]
LTDADSETFGELTAQTAQLDPPQNRIALVLDGSEVLVAPVVADRVVGPVQISGDFSETDAKDIAEALGG